MVIDLYGLKTCKKDIKRLSMDPLGKKETKVPFFFFQMLSQGILKREVSLYH